MIVNEKLIAATTPEEIERIGFTRNTDGSGSPWGTTWDYENDKFHISIDPTFVVTMTRKNPDTDPITLEAESLFDLEMLIDWIAD